MNYTIVNVFRQVSYDESIVKVILVIRHRRNPMYCHFSNI